MPVLAWSPATTPASLATALRTLGETYPLREDAPADLTVAFSAGDAASCRVSRNGARVTIAGGTDAMALRAVSSLLAGSIGDGESRQESSPFTSFGIMLDCSRNAVMTVPHLKRWLTRLALLGYNQAMLYTEDTYELPDEPWFGYLRGAYTADELRELDDVAASLGIELVPCIQTLGHLEQMLKWFAYREVCDTRSVLLAGEEQTYILIDKMLAHWKSVYRTRRIHLGMDETHDLGRGRFMDRFGYKRGFDIFNEHLSRVVALCEKHGLQPMIWSDMYFRMGSATGEYYDPACKIPADVIEQIPHQAQLVYWDYYHKDIAFYLDWIQRHRDMGFEPIMGSGIWTWGKFWHDQHLTQTQGTPCIAASREAGLKELFFTMWGDDGGYCDFDSAFAGLALMAEQAFAGSVDDELLRGRYQAVCGGDYAANCRAAELCQILNPAAVIWDDPLLMIFLQHARQENKGSLLAAAADYRAIAESLAGHAGDTAAGNLRHAAILADLLARKTELAETLIAAYAADDLAALAALRPRIDELRTALGAFLESLRAVWMAHNKPFGFEVQQIRLSGQIARYGELDRRLRELQQGDVETIPELEVHRHGVPEGLVHNNYRNLASASPI